MLFYIDIKTSVAVVGHWISDIDGGILRNGIKKSEKSGEY